MQLLLDFGNGLAYGNLNGGDHAVRFFSRLCRTEQQAQALHEVLEVMQVRVEGVPPFTPLCPPVC